MVAGAFTQPPCKFFCRERHISLRKKILWIDEMTDYQLLFNGIVAFMAVASLVFSVISFKRSNAYTKGQIEIAVRNMIVSARAQFYNISCALPTETEHAHRLLDSALEDWLNAYDDACAKYIDGKIDRERFKKLYFEEIKNCVERNKEI